MKSFGRLSGRDAGKRAVRVYVCRGCETHYKADKPAQCHCGRMDFDTFSSTGEANMWAGLRLRERRGQISELRRQTRHALYACGPHGQPVQVGIYIDDASFIEDGKPVIVDHKPESGMDPLAALKLEIMKAMGKPVTIHTRSR